MEKGFFTIAVFAPSTPDSILTAEALKKEIISYKLLRVWRIKA